MTPARRVPNLSRVKTARRDLCVSLAVRSILAVVGAVICVIAAVMVAGAGTEIHSFPIVVDGQMAAVTGYSGPHWASAIGLGAIAGLLLVSALTDAWRRHVILRNGHRAGGAV